MPYLGAYSIDDYLTFAVNTHNNKGQARDADAVPIYHIYEDEITAPLITGTMALLDGSNTVGFYSERVQLTSALGFELGKTYNIYVAATVQSTPGTISHLFQLPNKTGYALSSAGVDAIWDDGLSNNTTTGTAGYVLSSILNSVDNIAIVGAPAYEAPSSYVLSTGTQTGGTYQSVDTTNGVYHVHTDSGGLLSFYYEYSLKSDEEAVGILFKGRITSSNDSVFIQAYDWVNSVWVSVHTLIGTNLTTDTNVSSALVGKYTGTGLNSGKVRIRFINAVTLTTATLYIDQIIIGKTITGRSVGYQDALVWVDTNGSNTNTVAFVDGVADNPVSTIVAAYTLAASTGLKGLRFLANSFVTLTQSAQAWRFVGQVRVNLGGQSIADALFRNAYTVSGTSVGDDATFIECGIATSTIYHAYFNDCNIKGTITLIDNNEYFFHGCTDAVSNGTATLVFGSGTSAYLREWSGGIQLNSMQAGSECIIDGAGRVIIDPSCGGGQLTIRGHFSEPTGLAAFLLAGGTYTDNARWAEDQNMYAITSGYVSVTGTVNSIVADKTGYVLDDTGVDAIWNELQSGHDVTGSFGYYLDKQISSGSTGTSGGGTDWDATERSQIRYRLGLDGAVGTPTAVPTLSLEATSQDIKTQVNKMVFVGNDIKATLDNEQVSVTGTVNANVISQDNIDFGALQKLSLNAANPASVVGSVGSVAGNVAGSVGSVVSPVTVIGYVHVTGTVDANVEKWNTVDVVSNAIPAFAAGGAGGIPTVDASNYIAGIAGTKNQLDDLNDIAAGAQMDLINIPNATAVTAFTDDVFAEAVEGTVTFRQWLRRIGSILFGKASGGGAVGSKKFRNMADTVDRVDVVTDADGNRTSNTFNDT